MARVGVLEAKSVRVQNSALNSCHLQTTAVLDGQVGGLDIEVVEAASVSIHGIPKYAPRKLHSRPWYESLGWCRWWASTAEGILNQTCTVVHIRVSCGQLYVEKSPRLSNTGWVKVDGIDHQQGSSSPSHRKGWKDRKIIDLRVSVGAAPLMKLHYSPSGPVLSSSLLCIPLIIVSARFPGAKGTWLCNPSNPP